MEVYKASELLTDDLDRTAPKWLRAVRLQSVYSLSLGGYPNSTQMPHLRSRILTKYFSSSLSLIDALYCNQHHASIM